MVTRRRFIECALGGAAAAALPIGSVRRVAAAGAAAPASAALTPPPASGGTECVLVDVGSRCGTRESFAGYESALTSLGASWSRTTGELRHYPALVVVPAATGFGPAVAVWLAMRAAGGSTVILELGSAFAEDDSAFDADREALRQVLCVELERPKNLWPRQSAAMPYVDYRWPSAASVRDFSRVLPMTARDGDAIAHVGGMPVAVRCRMDLGTIVVLGSPLGPTLLSGDAEARRWLGAIVESSRAHMVAYEARERAIKAAGPRPAPASGMRQSSCRLGATIERG